MRLSHAVLGAVLGAALLPALPAAAREKPIDTARSVITMHVGKAGLFSAAAHDHTIVAPIASGAIQESAPASVRFTVEAAKMKVKPDPKVDAKTQAAVQNDMETMTLEAAKFPEIVFHSTQARKLDGGAWQVEGDLSLHGVTKAVSLLVTRTGDAYTAHTALRQTDFGIKPISIGGGMIRVKNEIELDFQIFPSP